MVETNENVDVVWSISSKNSLELVRWYVVIVLSGVSPCITQYLASTHQEEKVITNLETHLVELTVLVDVHYIYYIYTS